VADQRCDITDLINSQCAHCRRLPDPTPRTLGRPFRADYPGHCRDCAEPYAAGDRIRRISDDDGAGYIGPCCQEDQ
jgi:hypothetical protein